MDWRKSSYSSNNGGACAECGTGVGTVLIRDTTDLDGATLAVPSGAWTRFLATIK